MWVIDVSPVVASIGLAFMDQHCMQPVWDLKQHKVDLKELLIVVTVVSVSFYNVLYCNIWFQENLLTCIMDLSEYINSIVLWIRVILP